MPLTRMCADPVHPRLRPSASRFALVPVVGLMVAGALNPAAANPLRFDFTPGAAAPGHVQVAPGTSYTRERSYGFEPGATLTAVARTSPDALHDGFITSVTPFHFTTRVPREGNYRVTVTLGDAAGESTTTIKAELRRLMVENVSTARGRHVQVSFIVNTRTPRIQATGTIPAGEVRLKAPRETTQEAWAWDEAITLEFASARTALCAVTIEPVEAPTVFLLGDSTVCDQSREPFASWGQMITRWFKPGVAVANHGESGETYRDSIGRRRLDKILSVMQPGDWLIMQFGHNDQKQIAAKSGGPFTTYKEELKRHVDGARARGGIPVIVSPMERRGFDDAGQVRSSLIEYADAARQAAQELQVAFIDLNAMSKVLYAALGPEKSTVAFAAPGGKVDNTHHNNYGSYQLAKCIVQAFRDQRLPLGQWIVDDFKPFNPAQPDDPATFTVPASGEFTNQRPLGDEPNATTR